MVIGELFSVRNILIFLLVAVVVLSGCAKTSGPYAGKECSEEGSQSDDGKLECKGGVFVSIKGSSTIGALAKGLIDDFLSKYFGGNTQQFTQENQKVSVIDIKSNAALTVTVRKKPGLMVLGQNLVVLVTNGNPGERLSFRVSDADRVYIGTAELGSDGSGSATIDVDQPLSDSATLVVTDSAGVTVLSALLATDATFEADSSPEGYSLSADEDGVLESPVAEEAETAPLVSTREGVSTSQREAPTFAANVLAAVDRVAPVPPVQRPVLQFDLVKDKIAQDKDGSGTDRFKKDDDSSRADLPKKRDGGSDEKPPSTPQREEPKPLSPVSAPELAFDIDSYNDQVASNPAVAGPVSSFLGGQDIGLITIEPRDDYVYSRYTETTYHVDPDGTIAVTDGAASTPKVNIYAADGALDRIEDAPYPVTAAISALDSGAIIIEPVTYDFALRSLLRTLGSVEDNPFADIEPGTSVAIDWDGQDATLVSLDDSSPLNGLLVVDLGGVDSNVIVDTSGSPEGYITQLGFDLSAGNEDVNIDDLIIGPGITENKTPETAVGSAVDEQEEDSDSEYDQIYLDLTELDDTEPTSTPGIYTLPTSSCSSYWETLSDNPASAVHEGSGFSALSSAPVGFSDVPFSE